MSQTLYKVLLHGQATMDNSIFPVGTLSEEAQECRNRDYYCIAFDIQENVVEKPQTRTTCTE